MGGSDGGGGRHGGQTVGTAGSSGGQQVGQPSASAASRAGAGDTKRAGPRRNTMPRRRTGAAQAIHRQSGQPSDSTASQQATGDTKRPRPRRYHDAQARAKSKRARARYWRRGSRPLRVRKPKIFLGKGSKNRFRGAGAGKVGGVKNATEEENGAVLSKKEAAYAAADGEIGGRLYMERAGACVCARGCGLRRGRRRWSGWRRVSFSWHHENGQRESGTTMPRREIEKRDCLQSVGSSAIILSVPNRR